LYETNYKNKNLSHLKMYFAPSNLNTWLQASPLSSFSPVIQPR